MCSWTDGGVKDRNRKRNRREPQECGKEGWGRLEKKMSQGREDRGGRESKVKTRQEEAKCPPALLRCVLQP